MSGACYAGDLLGKPAGAPGLAEYFYENDAGVCVKQASYVPSPYPARRDIDALARFSRRATRERPLPAAVEAVVDAILGNRDRFRGNRPVSPDGPLTDHPLTAQLLRRRPHPPRVRRLRYRARLRHLLLHLHHHPGTCSLPPIRNGLRAQQNAFSRPRTPTLPSGVRLGNARVFSRRPRVSTRQRETIETVDS